jgi:hypothetical protein
MFANRARAAHGFQTATSHIALTIRRRRFEHQIGGLTSTAYGTPAVEQRPNWRSRQ